MIEKVKEDIWQLNFQEFGSCVYIVLIGDRKIIIDTGSPMNKQELIQDLKELKISPKEIDIVILTHNHFDHTGNIDLFTNAKIYGSKEDFKDSVIGIDQLPIKEFKIIKTPGHTPGGISILYEEVLFSGDTIFGGGYVGRTDFSGGDYEELQKSIEKLKKINYKILCPGHLV